MTRDEARAIALEELNKVLENHCLPNQDKLPVSLVANPVSLAERLTAAAMAAHVAAWIEWPVITEGPLVEALGGLGLDELHRGAKRLIDRAYRYGPGTEWAEDATAWADDYTARVLSAGRSK